MPLKAGLAWALGHGPGRGQRAGLGRGPGSAAAQAKPGRADLARTRSGRAGPGRAMFGQCPSPPRSIQRPYMTLKKGEGTISDQGQHVWLFRSFQRGRRKGIESITLCSSNPICLPICLPPPPASNYIFPDSPLPHHSLFCNKVTKFWATLGLVEHR